MLLDTCALLWLVHDLNQFSDNTLQKMNETPVLYVSSISAFDNKEILAF